MPLLNTPRAPAALPYAFDVVVKDVCSYVYKHTYITSTTTYVVSDGAR